MFEVNPIEEEMCLMDSCTTNSILREIKYFQTLTLRMENILMIVGVRSPEANELQRGGKRTQSITR
jgi:hypothetical protein